MTKKSILKLAKNGSVLFVVAQVVSNFLNFAFNAYLGRELSFANYGLVTFITSLLYLVSVGINAITTTVNHRVAYLNGQSGKESGNKFYSYVYRRVTVFSILASILWLSATPLLMKFFNVGEPWPLFAFVPLFFFAMLVAVLKGYLQGNLFFAAVGIAMILEALAKLILAVGFVQFQFSTYTYLAIPLSVLISFLITSLIIASKKVKIIDTKNPPFPRRFFSASIVSGLSTTAFLTIDVLLVKHYLNPSIAGEYALLSLIGKMIYFFGSLFNGFIITLISRDEGLNKNPAKTFYKILSLTSLSVTAMFLAVGPLGFITVPFLFGAKAHVIVPYLATYGLAIALFTLANAFLAYHLAKHHYTFPVVAIVISALMTLGIILFHDNIGQIVNVILVTSILNFVIMIFLHLIFKNGRFILANLLDFFDLFSSNKFQKNDPLKNRILIFNWRDTKHKFAGGAEVYIHELAKRWVEEGHQVTVFCGNDSKSLRYEVIDGVEIVRRGGFYFVYVWAFFYYILKFRHKYDVIIDCQNGIPFFAPLYAKEKVYCLMFHVHQEVFVRSLPKPLAVIAQTLENRVMPWAYKKTPFITISESSKEEIQALDLGKNGIEIVYPGIDLSVYKKGVKSKHPLILYVGRLQYYKSVHIFLKSAKTILKDSPNAKFIIAGDGEEKGKLISQAKELGIEESVSFLGKVSEQEKIDLYQKAWVFVNPSLKEGWGITTIEANACGTPVIASDVPGLKDSVLNPQTGFLVAYGDHDQFAKKISHLLNDHTLRATMSGKALDWANNFDWRESARKGLDLIS